MAGKKLGLSNREIARRLGVCEGTIRYRLKNKEKKDGRKNKYSSISVFQAVIKSWVDEYKDRPKITTIKTLYTMLVRHHNYFLSYDALRRYIRKHHPEMIKKSSRVRVETPPGALMQVDWKEDVQVQIGKRFNWAKLQFLNFLLAFSRDLEVIVSEKKTLRAFISCHQKAFRKMQGLPEWIRTDCLKSAIVKWNGEGSIINEQYKKYMGNLGISVFPARPGTPTDKGKVEKRIKDLFLRLDLRNRVFKDLKELQGFIDRELELLKKEWRCGATGLSVKRSYEYEKEYLKKLPDIFPEMPLKEKRTLVRRDATVYFVKNYYQVPQVYAEKSVLCLHTGHEIQIFHGGVEIARHPYLPGTEGMVMLSEQALKTTPIPMSERVRTWALEVASCQVDIYNDLIKQGGAI